MSLGSIAHLQYYFARTGVLDGKGGQLARDTKKGSLNTRVSISDSTDGLEYSPVASLGGEIAHSPIEEEDLEHDWDEPMMLPPTVSTYSHRTQYIPPPPDNQTLRRELQESLGHAKKALNDVHESKEQSTTDVTSSLPLAEANILDDQNESALPGQRSPARGWHEIQGMHILDVVTLAIKAAKEYYTMHENSQLLSKVKSERQLREELLGALDVLKRMATRNFAGGMKESEVKVIDEWISSVETFLTKEKEVEAQEAQDRESWRWLEGDWAEGDCRREWEFMKTFIEDEDFPTWDEPPPSLPPAQSTSPSASSGSTTPFLKAFADGLTLVKLHNRVLKKSKRQFGEIKDFHTDTAKPYRAADNLRYWIKAAEIRWETKLKVDVMGVVYDRGEEVWREFEAAVLQWCRVVREEITREWKIGAVRVSIPTVMVV